MSQTPLRLLLALLAATLLSARPVAAQDQGWEPLIRRLANDGFVRGQLEQLFARPETAFDAAAMGQKMMEMYSSKFGSDLTRLCQARLKALGYYPYKADGYVGFHTREAIKAFQRANGLPEDGKADAELLDALNVPDAAAAPKGFALPPKPKTPSVYEVILTPERMAEARDFYRANKPILKEVQTLYGVTPEVAVGLLAVETRVGKFLGDQIALVNLASMARCASWDCVAPFFAHEAMSSRKRAWVESRQRQKADWAYGELKALLRYAATCQQDPLVIPGSIYGAIGVCQFMPSNVPRFGKDGNQDGLVDLFVVEDALHSMGNYLSQHGWRSADSSEAAQRKALYNYNHSKRYVNTIMAVAQWLKENG